MFYFYTIIVVYAVTLGQTLIPAVSLVAVDEWRNQSIKYSMHQSINHLQQGTHHYPVHYLISWALCALRRNSSQVILNGLNSSITVSNGSNSSAFRNILCTCWYDQGGHLRCYRQRKQQRLVPMKLPWMLQTCHLDILIRWNWIRWERGSYTLVLEYWLMFLRGFRLPLITLCRPQSYVLNNLKDILWGLKFPITQKSLRLWFHINSLLSLLSSNPHVSQKIG